MPPRTRYPTACVSAAMFKGFWNDFKAFAIKGNMIDLAVGVVIGAAFNGIINAIVEGLISPPLGYLTGGIDVGDKTWTVVRPELDGAGEVVEGSGLVVGYGKVLEQGIDFFIIAMVLFVVVRVIKRQRDRAEDPKDKTVPTPKDIQLLSDIKDGIEVLAKAAQGGTNIAGAPDASTPHSASFPTAGSGQAGQAPGYQHYIIKFRGATDRTDAAEVELAYARMATAAGIETAPSRLLSSASGRQYFATRRFDRARGRRLHMLSAAGYLHDNFRLPAIDYGHLMDAANVLTGTRTEAAKVLRLAAFNVLAHNRDDHSKNFAFLADERGRWRFAPAYDLTFSPSAHGEHSITVAGEGRAPGRTQLLALAEAFDIKTGEAIVEEVAAAVAQWPKWATEAGVGRESREEIGGVLKVGR